MKKSKTGVSGYRNRIRMEIIYVYLTIIKLLCILGNVFTKGHPFRVKKKLSQFIHFKLS